MFEFLFEKTPLRFLIQSLWRDEAFSVLLAKKNVFELLYLTAKDYNPPLYYLLLKLWMKIFGSSEIAVRSLSLVFYSLSVYTFVLLTEKIFKKRNKFLPTITFATIPIVVYYGFEARMYSLLVFISLAFWYSLISSNKKLLKITTLAGLYTHYFFIFNFIIAYFLEKKDVKTELKKSLILFLPWFIFVLFLKITSANTSFWLKKLEIKDILFSPFYLLAGYDKNWEPLNKFAPLFSLIFWIIIVFSVKYSSLEKKLKKLLLSFFLFPFFFSLLLSSTLYPIFLPRYLIFLSPLFPIFSWSIKNKRLAFTLTALLFLFNIYYLSFLVKYKQKYNFKNLAFQINHIIDKNTVIYLQKPEEYPLYAYYLPQEKIFLFKTSYESIPPYVGKIIIPKDKIASSFPTYPQKALLIEEENKFTIIYTK